MVKIKLAKSINKSSIFLLLIILVTTFIRMWDLSSDPSVLLDSGQVGDEGYWIYNARYLVMYSTFAPDDYYHDLAAAPLFSFFSFISFKIFGVGFWQARLISGLSGIITIFFAYKIASLVDRKTAIFSTLLISCNTLLLLHNRLGVGESLAISLSTISSYLVFRKGSYSLQGILMAFALAAKTTSYLYLPSASLMVISELGFNKQGISKLFRFGVSFSLIFLTILALLLANWGNEILQVYTTFGPWYVPLTPIDLFHNVMRFFLHPFWGSPFLFSLTVLALLNSCNYLLIEKDRTRERRLLVLWLFGILVFGPFIAILSNARMLGLIIPVSILATQTVLYKKYAILNFSKLSVSKIQGLRFIVFSAVILLPISAIMAKFSLALLKRALTDQSLYSFLIHLTLLIDGLLLGFIYVKKHFLKKVVYLVLILVIYIPIAAFVPLMWDYLFFFGVLSKPISSIASLITFALFGLSMIVFINPIFLSKSIRLFIFIYLVFNLFGMASIFYKPTKNISGASASVVNILGDSYFIGFWGHTLSIENKARPIYWAPYLNYASGFNAAYEQFRPKFLTIPSVFDSKHGSHEGWPDRNSLNQETEYVTTLNLSRSFLGGEREFKLNLYKIIY